MPPSFERYAKLLHRLDAHYEDIDHPLTEREQVILSIPRCTVIREFVETKRTTSSGTRLRWRELSELLNVPFEPEINHNWFAERLQPSPQCWPRFIYGPSEGTLDMAGCAEVANILTPFAPSQECFFRFAEMPFIATDAPLLFQGRLDEVQQFLTNGRYQFTPEYWWPTDQSWCLCSEYDLAFTVVAGPSQLIDALLRNDVLEVLEVTHGTRLDSLVPTPS
jgi:hypothetical protein